LQMPPTEGSISSATVGGSTVSVATHMAHTLGTGAGKTRAIPIQVVKLDPYNNFTFVPKGEASK
jgi:hypothetical protein